MDKKSAALRRCAGFTVVEIMITLVIIAVILSAAVPSVTFIIKNNRLVTQANEIMAVIHFARSEAVKRAVDVIICRSADPDATTPVCGGTAKVWTSGYLVFADDGNYTNKVYDAGSDILLQRGQVSAPGVTLQTNTVWDSYISYSFTGFAETAGVTAVMSVCDDRGPEHGKEIRILPSGIPMVSDLSSASCTL